MKSDKKHCSNKESTQTKNFCSVRSSPILISTSEDEENKVNNYINNLDPRLSLQSSSRCSKVNFNFFYIKI